MVQGSRTFTKRSSPSSSSSPSKRTSLSNIAGYVNDSLDERHGRSRNGIMVTMFQQPRLVSRHPVFRITFASFGVTGYLFFTTPFWTFLPSRILERYCSIGVMVSTMHMREFGRL